jgi:hypothetical protein
MPDGRRGRVVAIERIVAAGLAIPGPGATEILSGGGPARDSKQ